MARNTCRVGTVAVLAVLAAAVNVPAATAGEADRWTLRAAGETFAPGEFISALVATPAGVFVGAGHWHGPAGVLPAVWTSVDDGVTWVQQAAAAGGAFDVAPPGEIAALAVTPTGRIVAAGNAGGSGATGADAAFWTSDDAGATWTRRNADGLAVPELQTVTGLAAARDGTLIAIGIDDSGSPGAAAVWRSADAGVTWARAGDGRGSAFDIGALIGLRAVASDGRDTFAIVGSSFPQSGPATTRAWWSVDGGLTWALGSGFERLLGIDETPELDIAGLAGGGFVASVGPGPSTRRSADGRTWLSPGAGTAPHALRGLVVTPAGTLIGLGNEPGTDTEVDRQTAAFVSTDGGGTWTQPGSGAGGPFDIAGTQFGWDVALSPRGVVVGVAASADPPGQTDPHAVIWTSGYAATPFSDVGASFAWAEIACLFQHGLVAGTTSSTFSPTSTVTREQAAVLLVRAFEEAAGHPPPAGDLDAFSDTASSYARVQIGQLVALGVTAGIGADRFGPAIPVTREQAAVMLIRLYEALGATAPVGPTPFVDISASYAQTQIAALVALGVTTGTSPTMFSPGAQVSREQMAVFTVRLLEATGWRECPARGT